ncbi:MAG: guanylate kinase [Clostridiales bacterium]|nr:guanylate kinase [Clostridiales bacterium]MCC8100024.1 guanylate kinase [Clostridiales bacterium]
MTEAQKQGQLIVISGPSGVGKGTLIEELKRRRDDLGFSVSYTTRAPREQEVDGKHYFFVTQQEFQRRVETGDFLEYAGYADNAYGTSRSQVEAMLNRGQTVILDIETQGAMQVRQRRPDATLIYILPPSYGELKARLCGRRTEDEASIRKRLALAKADLPYIPQYDFVVVNRQVTLAVQELDEILRAARWKSCYRQEVIQQYQHSFDEDETTGQP